MKKQFRLIALNLSIVCLLSIVGCKRQSDPTIESSDVSSVTAEIESLISSEEAVPSESQEPVSSEPSVDRLWELFEYRVNDAVDTIADCIDVQMRHIGRLSPEMALNFMCHGPIERGVDITAGGVDNYNMCVDGAGLAVLADSFGALRQRVEEGKRCTFRELDEILKNNWEGHEDLRLLFSRTPAMAAAGAWPTSMPYGSSISLLRQSKKARPRTALI